MTPELDLIPINEAADLVCRNHRTIRRWISQGKLRAYRVAGTRVFIDRKDVDQLLTPVPVNIAPDK